MTKLLIAVFIVMVFASAGVCRDQLDFRGTIWGMTKHEVMDSETAKPLNLKMNEDKFSYEGDFSGLPCGIVYTFKNNKLEKADCLFKYVHSNITDFPSDFKTIKTILTQQCGEPIKESRDSSYAPNITTISTAWSASFTKVTLFLSKKNLTSDILVSYEGSDDLDAAISDIEQLIRKEQYRSADKMIKKLEKRGSAWILSGVPWRNIIYYTNVVNGKLGRVNELMQTASLSFANPVISKTEREGSGGMWDFVIKDKTGHSVIVGNRDEVTYFTFKGSYISPNEGFEKIQPGVMVTVFLTEGQEWKMKHPGKDETWILPIVIDIN